MCEGKIKTDLEGTVREILTGLIVRRILNSDGFLTT